MTHTPAAAEPRREEELRIDALLADFQSACEVCILDEDRIHSSNTKRRAILRNELRAAIVAARRDAERYKAALEDIANPILAIARDAEAEGKRVNGAMAVALAKDVGHLSGIARAALAATPEGP